MERGRALTLRPAAEVGAGDAGHLRRLNLQRMLAVGVIPTPAAPAPAAMLNRVADALRGLLREAQAPPERLLAVAAGAPGAVDRGRGSVSCAPNLEGWNEVPMREILEHALGTAVVVENDVNLAVLGEHWRGAARGHDTCAFIFVGTGIGAGILIDGT